MNKRKPWGQSTHIDLKGCDLEALTSKKKLKEFSLGLCEAIDMTPYKTPEINRFGSGNLEGYTVTQLIETSNISVHCDEVGMRAFIDIFSCKKFEPKTALEYCKTYFGGTESKKPVTLERG